MLLDNLKLTTSEESRVEERVRVSFLRNRGNLERVVNEVKLPREYVVKCLTKFRKACKAEGSRLVADQILTHLTFGYAGRVEHLMAIIDKLQEVESIKLSVCCGKPVSLLDGLDDDGRKRYECLKCHNETDVYESIDQEIVDRKMSAIDLLRKEDTEMCKFCEKLGRTDRNDLPSTVINNTQNILVTSTNGQIDADKAKQIDQLDPIEQETLRLQIEKTINDAEIIEEVNGQN